MSSHLQHKWDRLKMGEMVVTNANELDALVDYLDQLPDEESSIANHLWSRPNRNRCGILDQYEACIGYYLPKRAEKGGK